MFFNSTLNLENIYYFYSSASQAIAAFIAFLIAGYALVFQIMDNQENIDEEQKEINYKLKKEYHNEIIYLSISTSVSIILSLISIWYNNYNIPLKNYLMIITDVFIIMTIILAISFVLRIIDPDKSKKPANSILEKEFGAITVSVDKNEFITSFIDLEKGIRELIEMYNIPTIKRNRFLTMGEMIRILKEYELISPEIYETLRKITKYRNLVIHGHLDNVDQKIVNELKDLNKEIYGLKDNLKEDNDERFKRIHEKRD